MPNKNYPKIVRDYLKDNDLKKWKLEWNEKPGIEMTIIVPAIHEFENIKKLLLSLSENESGYLQKTLVIFVINNSINAEQAIKDDNYQSVLFLKRLINQTHEDELTKHLSESRIKLALIDAASEGNEFDENESGVGLARKIGMDEALKVFDYSLPDKKIIICLDADCVVEKNYLSTIYISFNNYNISAATIEYEHIYSEDEINASAILSYEIFLRHYVVGLLFANSSYAFHTIGSTIAVDYEAYIKSGGMNKRHAAEDFYFLQKLAKIYDVQRINSTIVKPSSRESWRVPFGTGRSMMDFNSNGKKIRLYDPEEYLILKTWLELFNSDLSINTDKLLKEAKKVHKDLYDFLEGKNFSSDWNNILDNCKTEKQLNYQRKNWFDAFKTLKLIHHLRDASFPMLDIKTGMEKIFKLVDHSPSLSLMEEDNYIQTLQYYLTEIRMLEKSLMKNQIINSTVIRLQ